jgi:quercetin dioxygenase-like cupin family protein
VLLRRGRLVIANLRFAENATIDEHSAGFDIDIICLSGRGFVSVDRNAVPLSCGELITWPAGVTHRLWTEASRMETLMVEHHKT